MFSGMVAEGWSRSHEVKRGMRAAGIFSREHSRRETGMPPGSGRGVLVVRVVSEARRRECRYNILAGGGLEVLENWRLVGDSRVGV